MSDEPVDLDAEREKRRAALLLLSSKRVQKCYPCAWVVDEKTRTIRCSKCERVIDAFDCVLELARNFEEYGRNRDRLRAEIATLRSNEEQLRKVVNSLKGMERRLLKDWRSISGQLADHVLSLPAKQEYKRIVEYLAHELRRWRPADMAPKAAAPEPSGTE